MNQKPCVAAKAGTRKLRGKSSPGLWCHQCLGKLAHPSTPLFSLPLVSLPLFSLLISGCCLSLSHTPRLPVCHVTLRLLPFILTVLYITLRNHVVFLLCSHSGRISLSLFFVLAASSLFEHKYTETLSLCCSSPLYMSLFLHISLSFPSFGSL